MTCPLDTDGDGVLDYLDECPGTPKGATADARGCWVLKNLNFETAKKEIKPESYPILDEVAKVLKNNPGLKVEIQGHTDSQGSATYNKKLSEDRANEVRDYLLNKGIEGDRLSSAGYGLSKPTATNDTAEGRAMNRRLELKPIR